MERALELAADHGGTVGEREGDAAAATIGRRLAQAFLRAPYLRDVFVACGVISDTFETAITWDRFAGLPRGGDRGAASSAVREVCGGGRVTCRFTHVYPDGPAPYFTVVAPARRGRGARAVGRDQGGGRRTR